MSLYVFRCPSCGLMVEVDFTSTNLKCPECLEDLEFLGVRVCTTSYACTNSGYWIIVEEDDP